VAADTKIRYELFHPSRFGRALKLAWESSPRWMAVNIAIAVLQSGLPLLSLYLYKLIIDAVEQGLAAGDVSFRYVGYLIAAAAAGGLLTNLLRALSVYAAEIQGQEVADHMLGRLHEKSVAVDLSFYENPEYQDTLHRAQQEAGTRPVQIVRDVIDIGRNSLSLLLLAGLLFSFHWSVVVVLFTATLPGVLLQLKSAGRMYEWRRRKTQTERKAHHLNWILTSAHSAREIRLFNLGPFLRERFRELRRQLLEELRVLTGYRSRIEFISDGSSTVALFGAFAFLAWQTLQRTITLGTLVVAYQAFQQARTLLRDLIQSLTGFYQNHLFLANVYEFMDLEPQIVEPAVAKDLPRPMRDGIVFEGVGFRYPSSNRPVLENVNLTIRPEEVVALVGENGAGKTTLVKLLCRFYDPTEGRITLDGVDMRDYSTASLRREMSVIFQDYIWYHLLTARENIWMGNVESPADNDAIAEAVRKSGADGFIRDLPKGYDNLLGSLFETGRELSIGQWQKLALARAFYREAQLLVLDEPSSALDALAEAEVFDRFQKLIEHQTAVLISHRLSNVRSADRIFVLSENTLAESGTHDELMEGRGVYCRMFEAQARNYR
jgi:ATP-binding cassette, subfamily B, bacterial